MKDVDLADIGGASMEHTLSDAQPSAVSEVHVYVLSVTLLREYGWTSVHHTYNGAVRRLEERVAEMHLTDEYRAGLTRDFVAHSDAGPVAAGDEDDDVAWGISRLPVEK